MRILGMDLGTKTGWAVVEDGKVVDSGVVTIVGDTPGQKLVHAAELYSKIIVASRADALYYERVRRFMSSAAAFTYNALLGVLLKEYHLRFYPVQPHEFSPTEIKKFATGSGKAKKPEMVAAAATLGGVITKSDDEADAVLIALLGYTRNTGGQQGGVSTTTGVF